MKINELSLKYIVLIYIGLLLGLAFFIPLLLDLFNLNVRIFIISILSRFTIIVLIVVLIIDIVFLFTKVNLYSLSILNMGLTFFLYILLVYSFLNNIYEVVYVMNYSNTTLPLIYKIVAIWAGEDGSIMTWMLFNSIIINFYRIKNQNREDLVFIRSVAISLIVSVVFLFVLFYLDPFEVDLSPAFPGGLGLSPLLISPFMIWHPFFTFMAYAIFLIPFTTVIVESFKRGSKLLNSYQQNFYDFSLKFGWLVMTLSIGLGAYWAKIALTWGRYWGWDPVETVSLIPWLLITALFHTRLFKKSNPRLIKINVGIIFFSILFSTLITRGGLSPLHSFTGGTELVIWVSLVGLLLVIFSLYALYIVLDYLMENYKNKTILFDCLSYLFLISLAFVCIFGLFITPFTFILSSFLPIDMIVIGPNFFTITALILAVGLAITLIFCSLWEYTEIKSIILILVIVIAVQTVISFLLLFITGIWINPVIMIYFVSIIASLFRLIKNFSVKKGFKHFFRLSSKSIIHAGLSFILVGTLITSNFGIAQDFFYITGFFLFLIGITPSIIISFFPKMINSKNEHL